MAESTIGRSVLARIAAIEESGTRAAIVTVVRSTGSTPREPGARMIVYPDGSFEGTIGGGRVEEQAKTDARAAIEDGRPRFIELSLTQELGMCCGGSVALFIEVIARAPRLIVYGAGHVGTALTRIAAQAGFVVHVADEREELLTESRLPEARELHLDLDDPALPFSPLTYVMVTTHDHGLDQRLVEKVLKKPRRWLGLIGSRRKAELTRQRLDHKGFDAEAIASVRSPVGFAIGAETPEEIAIAIVAELIADRRGVVPARAEAELPASYEDKVPRHHRSARAEPARQNGAETAAALPPAPAGIILAAGRSSRMGRPKALLEVAGHVALERLASVYRSAGLSPVVIVAGSATMGVAKGIEGAVVVAGDPDQPMIDSLARGIEALPETTPSAVVQPVDAPYTTQEMIAALLRDARNAAAAGAGTGAEANALDARILTHGGVPGHPVLVFRTAFSAIRARPDGGLEKAFEQVRVERVEHADPRILADLDTPADLAQWEGVGPKAG